MKKTYEKPRLDAAAKLSQSTAALGRSISYCGPGEVWIEEKEGCYPIPQPL